MIATTQQTECYCGHTAVAYHRRKFTTKQGNLLIKVLYVCLYCHKTTQRYFSADDTARLPDVVELLEMDTNHDVCTKCKEVKEKSQFVANSAWCCQCRTAYANARTENLSPEQQNINKERRADYQRRYHKTAGFLATAHTYKATYVAKNPEKIKEHQKKHNRSPKRAIQNHNYRLRHVVTTEEAKAIIRAKIEAIKQQHNIK